MPEGDSVRRASRALTALVGERIVASAPHPRGSHVARAIDGRVLEGVDPVGKNLLLRFEGDLLVHSHLGMRGRWSLVPTGRALRGLPWLVLRGTRVEARLWGGSTLRIVTRAGLRLGPDILAVSTDVDALARRVIGSGHRLLGEALVDQRLVAGIGNMWLAELLWHGRLSPWARVEALDAGAVAASLAWVRAEMGRSVAGARPTRQVYRRAGRPCRRCGTSIRSHGLGDGNRTAYWCPACQVPGSPEHGT